MLKYPMIKKITMSANEKEYLANKTTAILQTREDILFAYIFGSFTTSGEFSDIDIGVFTTVKDLKSFLNMELEMERELGDVLNMPVDVRIINSAPLSFVYNVLKSGIVILDNDKSMRADFEGLIYKKYFDYKHLRDEYLREILNAAV